MFGPTLSDEVHAAGLAGTFTWTDGGAIARNPDNSDETNAAIDALIAAHDARDIPAAAIKAEAARRILEVMPEYEQRNALAAGLDAIATHGADASTWPAEVKALHAALTDTWTHIQAIRAASDALEALDQIPADFRDDRFWPART